MLMKNLDEQWDLDRSIPGPWVYQERTDEGLTDNIWEPTRSWPIARVTCTDEAFGQANARLIAAAPELLEALKHVGQFLTFDKGGVCIRVAYKQEQDAMYDRIQVLIHKAEGIS